MKIDYSFSVNVRVREIEEDGSVRSTSDGDKIIELKMNNQEAACFVYKFMPYLFTVGDKYIISIKMSEHNESIAVIFLIDKETDDKYVIMNKEEVITDVLHGLNLTNIFEGIQILTEFGLPDEEEEEE